MNMIGIKSGKCDSPNNLSSLASGEIGKAVSASLDHNTLDDLLAGLVEFGLLTATRDHGLLVFRAVGNFPIRLPGSEW
jgi:hypothetical protein